jgi:hypothetical protein
MAAHWSRGLSRADAQLLRKLRRGGASARRRAAPLSRIIDVTRNAEGARAVPVGSHSSALPRPVWVAPQIETPSRC